MTVAEKLREEGLEQGREKGLEQAASNLFAMGMTIEIVAKATGLPIEHLEQLRAHMA